MRTTNSTTKPDPTPNPAALIEHLQWEWAARQGLIDGVGGTEWRRRHRGTRFVTPKWLEAHARVVEAIDGGRRPNADLTNALMATVAGPRGGAHARSGRIRSRSTG